jgi:hypothetical protein
LTASSNDICCAGWRGFPGFPVDDGFDFGDLLGGHRRVVAEVETGLVRINQRALLRHVAAQHFAQGLVHQVGGRVVADGARAWPIHLADTASPTFSAPCQHAVVAEHVGLDLQRVADVKLGASGDHALVAHLAARFGVERRGVQHHDARSPAFSSCTGAPSTAR